MDFASRGIRYAAAIAFLYAAAAHSAFAGSGVPAIRYSEKENMIVVTNAGTAEDSEAEIDLPFLARAIGNPALLREESPKVWVLGAALTIEYAVRLDLTGDTVAWLKLESNSGGYVRIENYGGNLIIRKTKITSWDSSRSAVDAVPEDGRAFIVSYGEGRMDIEESELMYLGSAAIRRPAAAAWLRSGGRTASGGAKDSTFAYNDIGVYTESAQGLQFIRNIFRNNVQYGLDPHDDSRDFLIEENKFFDNGINGLIFAEGGARNVIRKNEFFGNRENGLYLFNEVNDSVIEENVVYRNGTGIRLTNSRRNRIGGNTVYDNQLSGVLVERLAAENTLEGNTVYGNSGGIRLAEAERNRILDNVIVDNWYGGVRISTHSAGNAVRKNRFAQNDNGNIVFFVEGVGDVGWWPGFPFKLKAIYLTVLNYLY